MLEHQLTHLAVVFGGGIAEVTFDLNHLLQIVKLTIHF